jgi:ParB family chromosome partitioning protein
MHITHIPTASIDAEALPRDRLCLDPEALATLTRSITAEGQRQPIEVFPLANCPPCDWGLISGYRRLSVFRTLAALRGNGDFTTIAAFIRTPASIPAAIAAMVSENEIRADISPWERARLITVAISQAYFDTPDAAIATLHPHATAVQKSRLRAVVSVVDALDEVLMSPQVYSLRQLLRLASALRAGFAEVILTALYTTPDKSPEAQWAVLQNVLLEAEQTLKDPAPPTLPGRPRRILYPRSGLTVRRERTQHGWSLHFTGEEAHGMMLDSVMDAIERMYGPP